MNKKGLTLIELLAVIIVLAIVALITVPQILKTINRASKDAAINSAYGYINAVEVYASMNDIDDNNFLRNGLYQVNSDSAMYSLVESDNNINDLYLNNAVNCKGKLPKSGIVTVEDNKVISAILDFDDYTVFCENRKCEIPSGAKDKEIQLIKYYNRINNSTSVDKLPTYDFVQPWFFNDYNEYDIVEYIKKLKRAGYRGLIFQYSMEYNVNNNINIISSYYDSNEITDTSKLQTYKKDILKYVLEAADDNDFKIYIGIPYTNDWYDNKFTDNSWQNYVNTFSTKAIDEIYNEFNTYSSFEGWYWPFEMYLNDKDYFNYWTDMLNNVINKINSLNDSRSIMTSIFVSELYDLDVNEIRNQLNSFLTNTNFRNGDIINMQDSIGNLDRSIEDIYKYIIQTSESVNNSNKNIKFWLDIENYDKDGTFKPTSLNRYKMQIKMASLYAEQISSFSYSHYFLNNENDKLYRDYYSKITNTNLSMISIPVNGDVYEDQDGKEVPVPKDFTVDEKNNRVKDGLVIKDSSDNEFVWIPVNGKIKENCYEYKNDEYKIVNYARYLSNGVTCDSVVNDTLPLTITSDTAQILKYGGFYVGRYETSYSYNNGNYKPMVKASTKSADTFSYNYVNDLNYDGYLWNNINYANAKSISENMSTLYNYDDSIKTGLINGKQWDTILRFIHISDNTNMIYDSRKWGNYNDAVSPATKGNYETGVLKPSGSNENWKAKNIYDMAGNLAEWTSEISSSTNVIRSNGYNSNGQYGSASYGFGSESYNFPNVGFRIVLYIK